MADFMTGYLENKRIIITQSVACGSRKDFLSNVRQNDKKEYCRCSQRINQTRRQQMTTWRYQKIVHFLSISIAKTIIIHGPKMAVIH